MKNRLIAVILLVVSAFALSSCVKSMPEYSPPVNSSTPIEKSVQNFKQHASLAITTNSIYL